MAKTKKRKAHKAWPPKDVALLMDTAKSAKTRTEAIKIAAEKLGKKEGAVQVHLYKLLKAQGQTKSHKKWSNAAIALLNREVKLAKKEGRMQKDAVAIVAAKLKKSEATVGQKLLALRKADPNYKASHKGRPKGSTNTPKAVTVKTDAGFKTTTKPPTKHKGRPKGSKNKATKKVTLKPLPQKTKATTPIATMMHDITAYVAQVEKQRDQYRNELDGLKKKLKSIL